MTSASPTSSVGDPEKGLDIEKSKYNREEHLTEQEQDLHDAAEPPFTEHDEADDEAGGNGAVLEQVPSAKSSVHNIRHVPNGGLQAWLQVLGSFFLFWNTWGIVNAFGTYQTYYETGLLSSSSPSDIAWIGSVQASMLMFVGSVAGPLYDAGYVHTLLLSGTFFTVFGQMMLSLCSEYYQVFLAQAICVGVGLGLLFVPAVAILSTYFSTKISTAIGIAAAGSSISGVILPVVLHRLLPRIGFPWATRVVGFIMLGTLAVSNVVLKVRVLPSGRRKFLDPSAFKEPPYVLFVAGMFLAFIGLYDPFFYVQSYAIESGIANPNLAFYMLSIINATSTFGRILPGYIADRIGPLNMMLPCMLFAGILCICLAAAHTLASTIVIISFYGFFSGALVSLPATIFVHLTKNRAVIGTRIGMGFAIIAVGLLIGTPISGQILNASSFYYVWIFGGVMTVLGAMSVVGCRIAKAGLNPLTKA